jgi:hypothetical protein
MLHPLRISLLSTAMLLLGSVAVAQIPVELFGGNQKATLDIMFFKFLKNKAGNNTPFLFFNRNRASVDYRMTSTSNLPQFGFTEAISYNNEMLKGFAPVMVAQVLGSGVYSKAGVQFARIRPNLLLFCWVVCKTKKASSTDFFFLGRYTPKISSSLNLFSQIELVNSAPWASEKMLSFTQRARLGLKWNAFQFGAAADFSEIGRNTFATSRNWGAFLRYEF